MEANVGSCTPRLLPLNICSSRGENRVHATEVLPQLEISQKLSARRTFKRRRNLVCGKRRVIQLRNCPSDNKHMSFDRQGITVSISIDFFIQ